MKARATHPLAAVVFGCCLTPAFARTAAPAPAKRMPMASRLAADLGTFAGSTENATALLDGLRSGGPITLTAAAPAAGTPAAPDGILSRRAAGFGWGRIAHAMGMKLGPTVSGHGPHQAPPRVVAGAGVANADRTQGALKPGVHGKS